MAAFSRFQRGFSSVLGPHRQQTAWAFLVVLTAGLAGLFVLQQITESVSSQPTGDTFCPAAVGWTEVAAPPPLGPAPLIGRNNDLTNTIAASWERPGTIFAVGLEGLYRTDDCGATW